jgi:tRNA dimethylallyltransferase
MSFPSKDIPIVILVGPTAVGKTAAAVDIAEQVGAEILSCDSRYFYKWMDIGTAKPSLDEMRGIPHHLIDIANPDEIITLGDYKKRANALIEEIHARGKIPLIVGGTGQYIRSLVEGWDIPEAIPDLRIRDWLSHLWDDHGSAEAVRWLAKLDPASHARMDLQNPRRVLRALEVILSTGVRFSQQRTQTKSPYRILQIGLTLPREELYARIDQRIDLMIARGFIEEVRFLMEKGFDDNLPSMSAIGYPEIRSYLTGMLTLDDAIILIKRRTRNYVRKQANWFKLSDTMIHWYSPDGENIQQIIHLIKTFVQEG